MSDSSIKKSALIFLGLMMAGVNADNLRDTATQIDTSNCA